MSMKWTCNSHESYRAYAPVLNAFAESHHVKNPSYPWNQDLPKVLKVVSL